MDYLHSLSSSIKLLIIASNKLNLPSLSMWLFLLPFWVISEFIATKLLELWTIDSRSTKSETDSHERRRKWVSCRHHQTSSSSNGWCIRASRLALTNCPWRGGCLSLQILRTRATGVLCHPWSLSTFLEWVRSSEEAASGLVAWLENQIPVIWNKIS